MSSFHLLQQIADDDPDQPVGEVVKKLERHRREDQKEILVNIGALGLMWVVVRSACKSALKSVSS